MDGFTRSRVLIECCTACPNCWPHPKTNLFSCLREKKIATGWQTLGWLPPPMPVERNPPWLDSYSETLRGRHVSYCCPTTIPLARSVRPRWPNAYRASQSRYVSLNCPICPPREDVSDWLDAGGKKARLLQLARNTPTLRPARRKSGKNAPGNAPGGSPTGRKKPCKASKKPVGHAGSTRRVAAKRAG